MDKTGKSIASGNTERAKNWRDSLVSQLQERSNIAVLVAGVISRAAASRLADIDEISCCCDVLGDYLLTTADIIDTNTVAGEKAG